MDPDEQLVQEQFARLEQQFEDQDKLPPLGTVWHYLPAPGDDEDEALVKLQGYKEDGQPILGVYVEHPGDWGNQNPVQTKLRKLNAMEVLELEGKKLWRIGVPKRRRLNVLRKLRKMFRS